MAETVIENQSDLDAVFQEIAMAFYEAPGSPEARDFYAEEVDSVEALMQQGFQNERAPDGSVWVPNHPSTVRKKGHSEALRDTGRLGVSLVEGGHPDAVIEIVAEPGQGGFSRGTSVEYSGFNQQGTKHIPARPHVGVSVEYVDGLTERAADFVVEQLKEGA